MSKVIAKYWGHEDDPALPALQAGWWIEYEASTLAECWKRIIFDGLSSDDYKFVEQEEA